MPKLVRGENETRDEPQAFRIARGTEPQVKLRLEQVGPGLGPADIARVVASLRAPLADLTFESSMLQTALDPNECGGASNRIAATLRRLERVIDELADIAAIQEDRLVLYRRANEMRSLVGEIIERAIPPRDRARIYYDGPPACLAHVDTARIERVITSLLLEALRASPVDGGIVIRLEVTGESMVFSIIHGGRGAQIDPDDSVWWYACRRIVEAHGGSLDIQVSAAGSRFYLAMPRAAPREIRALVVDDDRDQLTALSELLRRSGLVVSTADCGSVAIVSAREVDVAIVDAELPDVPGVQLVEQLRDRCPHLPIIIVSGHQRNSPRVAEMLALSRGVYVPKPINISTLLSAIVTATVNL